MKHCTSAVRHADRVAGACLLAFAIAFAAGALKNYSYWGDNGPGSAFLPFWLGVAMAVLAAILLVRSLRERDPGPAWLPDAAGRRRIALVLGTTVAFVALLGVLGMVIGTLLFMVLVVRGLDRHRWTTTLAVAAGLAGFNYLVFTYWLKVPLPVGPWGF